MVSLPLVTFFAQGPVTVLTLYIVVITSTFWQSYLSWNSSRSSGKIQNCIPVEFRKLKVQPVPVTVWSKAWVWGRSLFGVFGFESCWRHESVSLVSVVCCQVQVSATGWSVVQRIPTECGVPEYEKAPTVTLYT
jgi:hypothetical protein